VHYIKYSQLQWSRILLEKERVIQLVKKFLVFYGTQRFNTMYITAHHWPYPEPPTSSPLKIYDFYFKYLQVWVYRWK